MDRASIFAGAEQPDLASDAMRQVVAAVRDPRAWATPASPGSMFGYGQRVNAASPPSADRP
jgi:hypothetical protein